MRISDWSSDVCSSDLGTFHIEEIQDQVELTLMRSGEHDVARAYVLYREKRSQERAQSTPAPAATDQTIIHVTDNGVQCPLDQIGRAHVWTPVTNAHLVCRLLLAKKTTTQNTQAILEPHKK